MKTTNKINLSKELGTTINGLMFPNMTEKTSDNHSQFNDTVLTVLEKHVSQLRNKVELERIESENNSTLVPHEISDKFLMFFEVGITDPEELKERFTDSLNALCYYSFMKLREEIVRTEDFKTKTRELGEKLRRVKSESEEISLSV